MREIKTSSGKSISFVSETTPIELTYVIGVFSQKESSGKTRFCVTGPSATGIIPTDRKTRKVVEKVAAEFGKVLGKDIIIPTKDFVRQASPMELAGMDEKVSIKHYRDYVETVKELAYALYEEKSVKAVCIDNAGDLYQSIEYANYGRQGYKVLSIGDGKIRDKSKAQQEFWDFINSLSSKPIILTHRGKDEYINNVNTHRSTWDGYKYLGNLCDVIVELERNRKYQEGSDQDDRSWQFGAKFHSCNLQEQLQGPMGHHNETGLRDEMISLSSIASFAFPSADPDLFI